MNTMELLKEFVSNYQSNNLFTKKDRLLIATSGGVDSVVLCKLCQLAALNFGIAHCNFQLRGNDSDRDETFVNEFAKQLNVPCYSIKFDTKNYAIENRVSTQVAARELRYKWFDKIAAANQYDYILTAHHADDNIETVLMTFFRGTGLKGLTGIKAKNGKLRRPLLSVRRVELESFLQEYRLPFVQDESNFHDDYTRNYFRNKVLPMVAEVFPEAEENILGNIERLKGVSLLYDDAIAIKRKKLLRQNGNEFNIPVLLLQQQKAVRTILHEIVKEYGFTSAQLTDILRLQQSDTGKYVLSHTHRILRNRKHLIIAPLGEMDHATFIIEEPGSYKFAQGVIEIKENASGLEIAADNHIALIDSTFIQYPLILRPWKTGDYFYPLGMQKKKKISRFLIDKKFSLIDKEKVWVLEMNKKIIWVVGLRIDDRFKLTDQTKEVMQVSFKSFPLEK